MKDWQLTIWVGTTETTTYYNYLNEVTEYINKMDIMPMGIKILHISVVKKQEEMFNKITHKNQIKPS